MKRNKAEYDYAGAVSDQEADELVQFVKEFKDEVEAWLEREHPEFW
ncbi:MAG: hypothetical protein JRG79_19065 [Deltaproteobacteria bacterium]|nr:hypothetical protein [Deltaproteobacteria bacterium]